MAKDFKKFFQGQGHIRDKAKDIDQGQFAFFRFQYEISKCYWVI